MKPLTLKEPAKCCQTPTLLWIPAKGYYMCPCGETRVDLDGQLIGKRKAFGYGRRKNERRP